MKHLLIILLSLQSLSAFAAEEILNFHSDIRVNKDRSITVKETITVMAEGYNIQRGIFRDIPTVGLNDKGRKVKYNLDVLEVLRDNNPENYDVSKINDGRRIRIGRAEVILTPGKYTYTITYRMESQVRFFDGYDELYWNVTGNQWGFTIQQASATLVLPDSAEILQHKGYSGAYGDSGCQCESEQSGSNIISYRTTQPLGTYQGLTIAVGWNKGVIPPPSEAELKKEEWMRNLPLLVGIGGLLLIFLYYLWAWIKVGRDPKGGTIIARFDPPEGYSPAAVRYILRMGFDNKAFTASIVSMAVKGFLTIDKTGKNYELKKLTDDRSKLSPGEKKVADKLFRGSDSITIKQSNHSTLSSAIRALEEQLKVDFLKVYFNKNHGWVVPGILLSIGTIIAMGAMTLEDEIVFFSLIITGFVSIFFLPIFITLFRNARNSHGFGQYIYAFILIAIPVSVGYLGYSFYKEFNIDPYYFYHIAPYFLVLFLVVALNFVFFHLIEAPTVFGRKRMDEIEGLKMFMEVAEKHRLNMMNPPDQTPQLFEKLLPYAIALNVENQWGKQFASIIEKAIENNEYRPTWYSGGARDFYRVNALTSSLGSNFSSAISSSSMAPQSSGSSGSGGGGSSGGGGGGGGGGGW